MNLPDHRRGEVIGTINCLHEAGHYTRSASQAAEALRLPGCCLPAASNAFIDTPQTGDRK
jgi:hypothetical protein